MVEGPLLLSLLLKSFRFEALSEQGAAPDSTALSDLHHRAHKLCFIANSVKSEIITHLD